jgi:hypothetical protein
LSAAPHAEPQAAGASAGLSAAPQAAGASAGLSAAPQAAGASAGLSAAPQAEPQEDAASCTPLFHPNKFESAMFLILLCIFSAGIMPLCTSHYRYFFIFGKYALFCNVKAAVNSRIKKYIIKFSCPIAFLPLFC